MTALTCLGARPDGVLLAMGDEAGHVRVWMPADNRTVATLETGEVVYRAAWTIDGTHLLVTGAHGALHVHGGDGTTRVRNLATGHDVVRSFAVHPTDPDVVATIGSEGTVRLWELATGTLRRELRPIRGTDTQGTVVALTTAHVAAGFHDGTFVGWDLAGEELAAGKLFNRYISAAAARIDGTAFVFAGAGGHILEVTTEWITRTVIKDPPKDIAGNAIAIAPDGRMLVACSDDCARLFKSTTEKYATTLGNPFWADRKRSFDRKYIVSGACFVPTTELIVTSHFTGALRVWAGSYPMLGAEITFATDDKPEWRNSAGAPILDPAAWWNEHAASNPH